MGGSNAIANYNELKKICEDRKTYLKCKKVCLGTTTLTSGKKIYGSIEFQKYIYKDKRPHFYRFDDEKFNYFFEDERDPTGFKYETLQEDSNYIVLYKSRSDWTHLLRYNVMNRTMEYISESDYGTYTFYGDCHGVDF